MLKIEFENLTSSILNSFFAITSPKKEVSISNLVCGWKAVRTITYIPVFAKFKKLFGFFDYYIQKKYFLIFGGQNPKISKIRDSSFVALSILQLLCPKHFSVFAKL